MPPRKKNLSLEDFAQKDGAIKFVLFGWCTTRQHEKCRIKFPGHKCNCECHSGRNKNDS